MENIIRLTEAKIENLKNVKNGSIRMNTDFASMLQPDVVGIYGQNGTGKTAMVEGFKLLHSLLSGERDKLPLVKDYLIYYGEKYIKLEFSFTIGNQFGEYYLTYAVTLVEDDKRLRVKDEEIKYRENEKRKKFKTIVKKESDIIRIRNKYARDYNEDTKLDIMLANKMAREVSTSFVFRRELFEHYGLELDDVEYELMKNMVGDFYNDFHVIDVKNYGYLLANILMPFSIHLDHARGEIPYQMSEDDMFIPVRVFKDLEVVVHKTNIVLQHLVPDLHIKINVIARQKLDDGGDGIRFEFLSKKGDVELPLKTESEGTLKIISILTTLIAMYNRPNIFIVIDELDASVFEYLLGEILDILNENGRGQLIFTSHNLRVLEVLAKENLWFTTTNENNRFIQLKGIKESNNIRDVYIRAVQLGGQDETIYAETDAFDIKKAFRKAGVLNGEG